MFKEIGLNANVSIQTPLRTQIESIGMISIFMNTILATIVAFLAILSVQLIYSLLLSDVDEKTYEFGMLRALGFSKNNVLYTVLFQGTIFAIFGIILGEITAVIFTFGIRSEIYSLVENTSTYWVSPLVIFFSFFFRSLQPKRAFGRFLR